MKPTSLSSAIYNDDGIPIKFTNVAEIMQYTNEHITYDDGYIPSAYSWHGPKTTYDRQHGVCSDAAIFAAYLIERDTDETCHLIHAYRKYDGVGSA
jgi:uncharacterized protein YijF (DUF1287 family)